jgi:hypothetical protein
MINEDWFDENWFDREKSDLKGAPGVGHVGACRRRSIEVRQIAGLLLLLSPLLPSLVSGTRQDWVEGLGLTLLSSPLLAWLSIPLRPSDDLFDETYRKQAEAMDVLALIILWTWPWTCAAPFLAIGRCVQILLPGVL